MTTYSKYSGLSTIPNILSLSFCLQNVLIEHLFILSIRDIAVATADTVTASVELISL